MSSTTSSPTLPDDGDGLVAVVGGRVWTGTTERANSDLGIVYRGDSIVDVGDADELIARHRRARVVDLDGAVVVPGLVNMHVHLGLALPGAMQERLGRATVAELVLMMAGNARECLQAGVTTLRLVGETKFADIALKRAIAAGAVDGPRIFTACHALCCTGGHGHDADGCEADGADGFRQATRAQIRAGADLIKVCISGGIAGLHEAIDTPQLTDDEMEAVISTAHDWGRLVTAHAGPAGVIARAVALGLDGVEHGYELTAELCATMADRDVTLCPTISVSRCEAFFHANGVPQWMIDRALDAGPRHWESLQFAIAAGVPIVMGTDMPPQAEFDETTATVREMEFMVDAGMTALATMRSATIDAAARLGATGALGQLAPGAAADFLVLPDDPTADISALRNIDTVVANGRTVRDDRRRWTTRASA